MNVIETTRTVKNIKVYLILILGIAIALLIALFFNLNQTVYNIIYWASAIIVIAVAISMVIQYSTKNKNKTKVRKRYTQLS